MPELPVCFLCLTEDQVILCPSCQLVHYCSQHQHHHHNIKTGHCTAFRVRYDCEIGRYLVATRNIKQGEIIYSDNPLVIGPNIR